MSVLYHEDLDILILGSSGVGKSTLINCYLTRNFSFVPSGVLKSKIQLPGTEYGCKSVNIHLCDTPAYNQWNENLEKLILSSSLILIVGAWDNPQSINRIENHWLPSLTNKFSIPVIVLINKSDMLGDLDNTDYMNQVYRASLCQSLQNYHSSVTHVFQTSAINLKSVINAFDVAIQLVIFPLAILKMDKYSHLIAALKRIFHILDRDNNGLLADEEILYYYRYCLTLNSMKSYQLQRIKKYLLSKQNKHSSHRRNEYISCNDQITLFGFVEVHLILIEMSQHDLIWKSLEKFGYKRRDLGIVSEIFPALPNRTQFTNFALIHNPVLRGNISQNAHRRIQYELNANVLGFLINIFSQYCSNRHTELKCNNESNSYSTDALTHEYSQCYLTESGLSQLLSEYGLGKNIELFSNFEDLELVGNKGLRFNELTLTQWLSLWSLLMFYETEQTLQYLSAMGAPMTFPSNSFMAKWTDYVSPQIGHALNTYQRFLSVLIVTYVSHNQASHKNEELINRFIRASVDDFGNHKKSISANHNCSKLNTVLLLKPKDSKSNFDMHKYNYGMLNDSQKSQFIYGKHRDFLHKNVAFTNQKRRKALIQLSHSNDHKYGIDIYHTLFENGNSLDLENETETHKNLRKYDCILYLHGGNALRKSRQKIENLYSVCRDMSMPIITVNVDRNNHNFKTEIKLFEILKRFDLPSNKMIKWESFGEDQMRFNYDLIQLLHFRQLYIPKTVWQIRKQNLFYYSKKATFAALGMGLIYYYLTPTDDELQIIQKQKKQSKYRNNERWKVWIRIAVATSVFCGSYYIYSKKSGNKKVHFRKEKDELVLDMNEYYSDSSAEEYDTDEREEQRNITDENYGLFSYVTSLFYPKFDGDDDAYNIDDDLSLTSFGFLKRKRSDSE